MRAAVQAAADTFWPSLAADNLRPAENGWKQINLYRNSMEIFALLFAVKCPTGESDDIVYGSIQRN